MRLDQGYIPDAKRATDEGLELNYVSLNMLMFEERQHVPLSLQWSGIRWAEN